MNAGQLIEILQKYDAHAPVLVCAGTDDDPADKILTITSTGPIGCEPEAVGLWLGSQCEGCGGRGEIFGHTKTCESEFCALAGGVNDCDGVLLPCFACEPEATT